MGITKKGSRSGGGLPGGLKMATGIIYLDANGSAEGIWKVLDNADHTQFNIDGVSQGGGQVQIDYSGLGLTHVVSFFATPDESLRNLGISIGCGAGLNSTNCQFFRSQDYNSLYFVGFDGISWSIQQYGGAGGGSHSVTGYNPATGIVSMSFGTPMAYPVMDIKTGGTGYQNYRVVEFDGAYGYNTLSIKLVDWAGGVYAPVNGDWFIFERKSQWISGSSAPVTNSPTNIFTNAPKITPLSTFDDIPVSGGGTFTNFQFLIFGK